MAKFRLKIDGVLEAGSFEEALVQIADHFHKLSVGVLPPDLFVPGTSEFVLKEAGDGASEYEGGAVAAPEGDEG